jgi:hypothetical protein
MNQTVKIETPKVKMNVIQAINAALDDAMAAD